MAYSQEIIDRFMSHVDKRGPDECWEWTGARGTTGYGHAARPGSSIPIGAHRLSYMLFRRALGDNEGQVCHKCDNRPCVNPNHLFFGSAKDNMQDMARKGRASRHMLGKSPTNMYLSLEKANEIRVKRFAGVTRKELANEYGTHPTTIGCILCHAYWPDTTMPTWAEYMRDRNRAIRMAYTRGETSSSIAKRYRLTRSFVWKIVKHILTAKADAV